MADEPQRSSAEERAAAYAAEQHRVLVEAQTAFNKQKFLQAFAQLGNVSAAAKEAGVGRRTHYDWLKADAAYAEAFDDAMETAVDALELEARRRAVLGVTEPIFHKGAQVGALRRFSDVLLIFLLKGARPDKYAERRVLSGKGKRGALLLEDIVGGPDPEGEQ